MKTAVIGVAGLAATSLLVSLSAVGCSSNKSSTSSSTSSTASASPSSTSSTSAPQAADYSSLLIQATDIKPPDGDTFTMQPPVQNPNGQPGVAATFTNQAGSRSLSDTIVVFPDAAAAATALQGATGALGNSVTGTPAPAQVGTNGTIVSGQSPDGSKAVTVLVFTEGKALTTLEFDSRPDDVVPPDFVTQLGQTQDTAIKNGLPG
jgi:hypothetical protein